MKKITDLCSKECICCVTKQECDIIMDMMHDAGLRWDSGYSYRQIRCYTFLPDQCYCPNTGQYSGQEYYEGNGYTIYPASDFIEQFIETERKPKQGEWVFVRNSEDDIWIEGKFLCEIPRSKNPYACVAVGYHSEYSKGEKVGFNSRKYIKQLPSEVKSTYTIECTEEQYEKVKDMILNSK